MRRAAKDGRYMGMAPYGYKHGRTPANKPCIQPNDDAPLVKSAFEKLATGLYHIEEVRKEMNKCGLKASRSRFWEMMRSPVYMGKIIVPSYKDEEEIIVQYWMAGNQNIHRFILERKNYHLGGFLCAGNVVLN